jgi:Na+-driven multidrug efflux pump
MLTIVYTLALGLGIGATAVVARRIGEKDPEGVIGAAGAMNAERLLELMGATPSMIATSLGYTQVMLAGNATVTLLFLITVAFSTLAVVSGVIFRKGWWRTRKV